MVAAFTCAMATVVDAWWEHHDLCQRLLAEQAATGAVFIMTFDAGSGWRPTATPLSEATAI
eukprot:468141-Heterocapsa_arctica.AAC.1